MWKVYLRRFLILLVFGGLPGIIAMILAAPHDWLPYLWIPIVVPILGAIEKWLRESKPPVQVTEKAL